VFYRWPDIPAGALAPEKAELAKEIAEGLPDSEILDILRKFVHIRLPNHDDPLEVDVTQVGLTVYLGGFDWVTFPTPPHILQKFPQFLPLPQQVFRDDIL
jgi:hypothetical protein